MAEFGRSGDQASGLRQLFSSSNTRVVAFCSGSPQSGQTSIVANIAAALARNGREILVIDEASLRGVAALFGCVCAKDLMDVINRDCVIESACVRASAGIRVLSAAVAARKLSRLGRKQQDGCVEAFSSLGRNLDYVLVDTSSNYPLGFSPFGLAADEAVMVLPAEREAITAAYSLMKKVSLGYERKAFSVLLNRVRNQNDARAIFATMERVAGDKRVASLSYAGCVPADVRLEQSSKLGQAVTALFPESPAAKAFQQVANTLQVHFESANEAHGIEHFAQQLLHLSQCIDPIAIYA